MSEQNLLDENIISLLGLGSLPEEEKVVMINKFADVIRKRTMLRVLESLTEEQEVEMEKISENPEEVLKYLAEVVPNFQEILNEEIIKLKEEMLKAAEQAE